MLEKKENLFKKIKRFIIGKAHNPFDPDLFQKLSLIALLAWIGLGSDALSSSSYGPQEAFLALGSHTYLAIFVGLFTVITIFIISASYSQLIEKFPSGGGGYLVASKLLSPTIGMISGCALLIDYALTITISIASGADAIFSFLPMGWQAYKLIFAVACIIVLIILNMRGVKESVVTLVPIFFLFVITHVFIIIYAIAAHFGALPAVLSNVTVDLHRATVDIGIMGVLFLLLHAYSMGAGTYTGIEAVSNSMNTLREPRVKTAKKTMRYMAWSLAFTVMGLVLVYLLYGVHAVPGKTLNAVAFDQILSGWGGFGVFFLYALLISEALLLFVAAQTGFVGGPRVLANMATDKWFPVSFTTLSDRLVTEKGILIMGCSALALMLLTGGSVSFLVILYSITVFITFTLSQLGMVRYWWIERKGIPEWKRKMFINAVGLILTVIILITVTALKFYEGGWITLLILGALVAVVLMIRSHYNHARNQTRKLDILVPAAQSPSCKCFLCINDNPEPELKIDTNAKTAVILVNGFNGVGLEALSTIFKLFGNTFKNFVFVEIGVIDAGQFKGADEIKNLQVSVQKEAEKYVAFMNRHNYHAEAITAVGIDVVDEIVQIAPKIIEKYPHAVFFGGQLVFKNDSMFTKVLHNYTVFALEKRLFPHGIPFLIIPIKV